MKILYALCSHFTKTRSQSPTRDARIKRPVSSFRRRPLCLLMLTAFLFFSQANQAQVAPYDTRDFLNNVVEIGLSDFGLVTGEDSTHIFFVCVRNTASDRIDNTLRNVKVYSATYKVKATKVNTTRFGIYTLVIYQAPKPPVGEWKKDFYHTLTYKQGSLSTFRDKWMSDKIWSILSAKMTVLKQPKDGIVSIKVPREAGIAKGMPLINSEGFIAGIVAEPSLGKSSVRAINMKEVALAMAAIDNDCRYFNMIEFGHTDNRCVEKAKLEAWQLAKQDSLNRLKIVKDSLHKTNPSDTAAAKKGQRKHHFIDYGFNANYVAGPQQVSGFKKDYDSETRAFHVGLSIHLNIDKQGARRVTLKPRYGNFNEINEPGLWSTPDGLIRVTRSSYEYVEMPVVFEQRLFHARNYSMAIGAGYSPGMVFGHQYRLQDKTSSTTIVEQGQSIKGSAIQHRLVGELYFYEFSFGRLGAVYMRDLTSYPHADQVVNIAGTDYKPFEARRKAWYLGLEVAVRLRGKW